MRLKYIVMKSILGLKETLYHSDIEFSLHRREDPRPRIRWECKIALDGNFKEVTGRFYSSIDRISKQLDYEIIDAKDGVKKNDPIDVIKKMDDLSIGNCQNRKPFIHVVAYLDKSTWAIAMKDYGPQIGKPVDDMDKICREYIRERRWGANIQMAYGEFKEDLSISTDSARK